MSKYSYALVDGVMRQTAIKDIYKTKEPIQVIPLYIGTRFQDNYDLGPILVASLQGSPFISQLQREWADSTTIVQSNHYLSVVADHLKQFITVTDETGSNSLFRFADPLTTWYWLDSYQDNIPLDIFGPISAWQVLKPIAEWQQSNNEWQTFTPPQNAKLTNIRLDYLNETQVKALDQAANFKFKNKLYQWLTTERPMALQDKTADQITQWLEQILANAQLYNLTSQRTIAQWLDLSIDYGLDFLEQPTGVYQQWLQHNSQYKTLPSDIKIEHFYQHAAQQS